MVKRKKRKLNQKISRLGNLKSKLMVFSLFIIIVISLSYFYFSSDNEIVRGEYQVGIIDQFYNQSTGFTEDLTELLEQNNITYNVHKDEEVTVELYRSIATYSYELIIFRVHSGIGSEGIVTPTFLFSSENYTQWRYQGEQLAGEIVPGVMYQQDNPTQDENALFSVGPMFFINSAEGDFEGANIILSSCYGLHDILLPEALVEMGASTVIGWDGLITLDHTDRATLKLIELALEKTYNISEVVEKTTLEIGEDQEYGSTLYFYSLNETEKFVLPFQR